MQRIQAASVQRHAIRAYEHGGAGTQADKAGHLLDHIAVRLFELAAQRLGNRLVADQTIGERVFHGAPVTVQTHRVGADQQHHALVEMQQIDRSPGRQGKCFLP